MDNPLMIFDGDCTFCRIWIEYWKSLTGMKVDYEPFQEAAERFPHVPRENFEKAVHLILPDGTVYSGACAVFCSLRDNPRYKVLDWMYRHVPGFAGCTEWGYGIVARNRDFFYHITKLLWGERGPHEPATRWFFLRAMGVIAFLSLLPKILTWWRR